MSAFQHTVLGQTARRASRERLSAALSRHRRRVVRRLAGQIWLHRVAACAGILGAVLVQACVFSLIARFLIGIDAAVLPDFAFCLYGLALGAAMLGLRPLVEATATSA
jgi:hypothetical protein